MSTLRTPSPARAPRTLTLPEPRGELSAAVLAALSARPGAPIRVPAPASEGILEEEDAQLTLYVLYELHYADLEGVDPRWEWDPAALSVRAALERSFEAALRALVPAASAAERACVGRTLQGLVEGDDGPPLSRWLETQGRLEHMLEHVVHRSAYQLKEADPHSFAIPRLEGAPKSALMEIQLDEYGGGTPERMHSALFARTMSALGLDPSYGAYLDRLPALTLATVNLVSMLALHRRLRGALVGHLAVFEMTSSLPNRRYANALRRLGADAFGACDFYDEHVEADAVHESIAAWDLADALARSEPALAADILFGARALLALEGRWAGHLLERFRSGTSSLRATALSAAATA